MRPADATRGFASSEDTPIVIKDVMYLSTPYGRVIALDAATGKERWAYQVPHSDQPATRGVSYWPGFRPEIVFGTRGGLLIALDAASGSAGQKFWRGRRGRPAQPSSGARDFPEATAWGDVRPGDLQEFDHHRLAGAGDTATGLQAKVRAFDVRTGREVAGIPTVCRALVKNSTTPGKATAGSNVPG